eukprot:gene24488-29597_t
MEGFLLKKGRGDSSFGRRNWKKRWFVLEDRELIYFEDLDDNGQPVGLKGKTNIRDAEITPIEHKEKQFTFAVKPLGESVISLQAPDLKSYNAWIKALSYAAQEEDEPDFEDNYLLLGLASSAQPNAAEVNRAYRKAALRSHPDKGGDLAQFKRIQEAYTAIINKLEEEEREKQFKTISYTVTINKNPGESGLGLVVVEDLKRKVIKIKDVLGSIKILHITEEAKGRMKKDDVLSQINKEDVLHMPLLRVAQKLNEFRVPVGCPVKLTFLRKVFLDGRELDEDAPAANTTTDDSRQDAHRRDSDAPGDIDETVRTFDEKDSPSASNTASPSYTNNYASSGGGGGGGEGHHSNSVSKDDGANKKGRGAKEQTTAQHVHTAHMQSENEELKAELLLVRDDLEELRKAFQSTQQENNALQRQLQRETQRASHSSHYHSKYIQVVRGSVIDAKGEYYVNRRADMKDTVETVILQQQDCAVSAEMETYLAQVGLSQEVCSQDTQRAAMRRAACAVSIMHTSHKNTTGIASDPRLLKSWSDRSGGDAVALLSRFGERLSALTN